MSQRRPRRSMTWPARGTSRSVTSRSTFPSGRWMFARDAGVPTIASLTDARASLTDGLVISGVDPAVAHQPGQPVGDDVPGHIPHPRWGRGRYQETGRAKPIVRG